MADDGEDAQMFLLTAIVMLAAFLALAIVMVRSNQASTEVARSADDPFMDHVETMRSGIRQLVLRLDQEGTLSVAQVNAGLSAMTQLASANGLGFSDASSGPCPVSPSKNFPVTFLLTDGHTTVRETVWVPIVGPCTT